MREKVLAKVISEEIILQLIFIQGDFCKEMIGEAVDLPNNNLKDIRLS
jgi:hypothetical protein